MKTPIAITLIIMGSLLVITPVASDYMQREQVKDALGKPGVSTVSLEPSLGELYRLGCWFTGSAMVAAAVVYSRRSEPGISPASR